MSVQAEGPADAIAALWNRKLPLVLERVDLLQRAVTALGRDALDEGLRLEARRLAHMLAGSLGMFGFAHGSELARTVELALADDRTPSCADAPRLSGLVTELREQLRPR